MPMGRHCPRIDTLELKLKIERKLGLQKAEKYFSLVSRYLSLKIGKSEFDRLCCGLIGREHICLHNVLVRAIIKNACLLKFPPPKHRKIESSLSVKVPNGYQRSCLQSICRDVFPQSPRRGRTPNLRDRKFKDRPSPLGLQGKTDVVASEHLAQKVQEQQSATELLSLSSRPPIELNSVEEGEEVEQDSGSPSVHSKSPVQAPFGIAMNTKRTKKVLLHKTLGPPFSYETCHSCGMLPDTSSLTKRLEKKLDMEGLKISTDCANLLNSGLDVFMKRLIKPCLELGGSRSEQRQLNQVHNQNTSNLNGMRPLRYLQKPNDLLSVSMFDFLVSVESNPRILGEEWPAQFERIRLRASEVFAGVE